MDFDTRVKAAVYDHFARTAAAPTAAELSARLGVSVVDVRAGFQRLAMSRILWLEPGGDEIRIAPPFSATETEHRVRVEDVEYFAACSWDAFGVVAAFAGRRAGSHEDHGNLLGEVRSRCGQTGEPIVLPVFAAGPGSSQCVAHFAVPAAQWWDDLVYT